MMLLGLMGGGSSLASVLAPTASKGTPTGDLGWGSFVAYPPLVKHSASDWASQWPQAVRQVQAQWALKKIQVVDRVPCMVVSG